MKKRKGDSVAAVLEDYRRIVEGRDWKTELELVSRAVSEYVETIKALIDAQRYGRHASKVIESLMVEVDEQKIQIFEMEQFISELNSIIEGLMEQIELLKNEGGDESE